MIYRYGDFIPVIDPSAFIHPQACVTGNVIIGADVYIGPGAAIRGDWGGIVIEEGCNVQENCTIHMFPGITVHLEPGAHIGHGAVIHGARIGANSLIGMNAVVMDEVNIGAESIVGALSFIKAGSTFEPRSLIVGNPAQVIRQVSDNMLKWKTEGTALYRALPEAMRQNWAPCEPLRVVPKNRKEQQKVYSTWKQKES